MKHYRRYFPKRYLRNFKRTNNPLFAWKTYLEYRKRGQSIPEEILSYLDKAAEEICKRAENPPEVNDRHEAIFKALGLCRINNQGTHLFEEYSEHQRDFWIAKEVDRKIKEIGKKEIVLEEVAKKYNTSASTIRRLYDKYMK
jgi:hypothetical protein